MKKNMISSEGREGRKNDNRSKYEIRFYHGAFLIRIQKLVFSGLADKLLMNSPHLRQ